MYMWRELTMRQREHLRTAAPLGRALNGRRARLGAIGSSARTGTGVGTAGVDTAISVAKFSINVDVDIARFGDVRGARTGDVVGRERERRLIRVVCIAQRRAEVLAQHHAERRAAQRPSRARGPGDAR